MLAADDDAERLATLSTFKVPLRSLPEEECIDLDNSDQHQQPDSDLHFGSGCGEGAGEDTVKQSQVEPAGKKRTEYSFFLVGLVSVS